MTGMGRTSRREFLKAGVACSAHLALMAAPFPASALSLWSRRTQGQIVAREAFGRLESVGEGLWAFVSTPLEGDYTTVCNGGIVAGRAGVLVVEAFQTPAGAQWVARQARKLTGRWPTHVLATHYHGDHTSGAEGFIPAEDDLADPVGGASPSSPPLYATSNTQRLKQERLEEDTPPQVVRQWADVEILAEDAPSTIDLGSRSVRLAPHRGHTASDMILELPEEEITWCGDLFWNGMSPNYVDAVPSQLSRAVRSLQADQRRLYVPGHGPMGDGDDLARYVAVIDGIEETARTARREGWTAQEAAARHSIPAGLGEWTLFNPSYFQRAVEAWMREWG